MFGAQFRMSNGLRVLDDINPQGHHAHGSATSLSDETLTDALSYPYYQCQSIFIGLTQMNYTLYYLTFTLSVTYTNCVTRVSVCVSATLQILYIGNTMVRAFSFSLSNVIHKSL